MNKDLEMETVVDNTKRAEIPRNLGSEKRRGPMIDSTSIILRCYQDMHMEEQTLITFILQESCKKQWRYYWIP